MYVSYIFRDMDLDVIGLLETDVHVREARIKYG